jgi:hypothetical protein
MPDILDDLRDLHKQATTERSHYYVAATCLRAIEEIESLRKQFLDGVTTILEKVQENSKIVKEAEARLDRAGL